MHHENRDIGGNLTSNNKKLKNMTADLLSRLNEAIEKYEHLIYTEENFHSILESLIPIITESHLNNLRLFLSEMEVNLELIDFMVSQSDRRYEYIKVINQIRNYMLEGNFRNL
jgi:hypothetical protein